MLSAQESKSPVLRKEYAVVIHGGAISSHDRFTDKQLSSRKDGLKHALLAAKAVLESGGTALDATEKAIRILEDDPLFNAGRGAVFNSEGGHELDASIMDGRDKSCGAVAGVKTVKNPISLARLVMTKTPHVLLAGDGADHFAIEMGVERVEQNYFSTPEAFAEWQKVKAAKAQKNPPEQHMGTVGCVALDKHGNLAAGTSTGGLTDKLPGRIGDSPIIGAGTYADNATCAVSCTGTGEHFIRHAVAHDISALIAYKNLDLAKAVQDVLQNRLKPGHGGVIAVDRNGNMVADYNTAGLSRAMADSSGKIEILVGK